MNNKNSANQQLKPFHTEMTGEGGPVVLFIHGFGGNINHWRHQIEDLSRLSCCAAFDLRGHGENRHFLTDCDCQVAARDALTVARFAAPDSRVIVVGHSMGTRIALELANMAPEHIAELVLVDGSCAPADPQLVSDWARREISRLGYESFVRKTIDGYLVDQLPVEERETLVTSALRLDPEVAICYWAGMAQWDSHEFEAAVAGVQARVTLLQSTSIAKDTNWNRYRITEMESSRWLDSWSRQAEAQIIKVSNAGHYTMLEQPGIVTNVIRDVLSRVKALGSRN